MWIAIWGSVSEQQYKPGNKCVCDKWWHRGSRQCSGLGTSHAVFKLQAHICSHKLSPLQEARLQRNGSIVFILFYCSFYLLGEWHMHECGGQRQLEGVGSLLSPCGAWGSNSSSGLAAVTVTFTGPTSDYFNQRTIWSQYVRNRAHPAACCAGWLSTGEDFCGYSIPQAFSCCLQMMLIWGLEAETGPYCERPRRKRHKNKAPHVTTTMAFCGKPINYNVDVSVLPSCACSVRSYPSRTLSACFHTQSISQGS